MRRVFSEDSLLAEILPGLPSSADLVVGPGDDCAVVRVRGSREFLLLKTDCVAEGVHFVRDVDPVRVGWKALCRALSDIAAMGGRPSEALLTIFSPPDVGAEYWKRFYRGVTKAAGAFGVAIAGGELSRQPRGIAVSVALTGRVAPQHLVLRSGGSASDVIFVTGRLGGSIAGHHLDFTPRLAEAAWLVRNARPTAMMDVSDGLASDLPRLARASGCGFEIARIPSKRGCTEHSALCDGEDYELLFSIPPRRARNLTERWKLAFPRVPLTEIGRLVAEPSMPPGWPAGWDHFSVVPARRSGESRGTRPSRK